MTRHTLRTFALGTLIGIVAALLVYTAGGDLGWWP